MNIHLQKSHLIESISNTDDADLLSSLQQMLDYGLKKQAAQQIPEVIKSLILNRKIEAESDPSLLIAEEEMNKYLDSF